MSPVRGRAVIALTLLLGWIGQVSATGAQEGVAAAPTATAVPVADTSIYSPAGADTCLGCHNNEAVTGIFKTKHARPDDVRGPFGHGGLQCEACHGPGGAHVRAQGAEMGSIIVFGPKAHLPAAVQNASCLACHQSNVAHEWAASAHAAADVTCVSCHQLHAAKDPVKTASTQIEVCSGCHQAQHSDLFKPSHHPLREGKMACTSCHSPHGSTAPAQLVRNTVNETCTSCHAEYRGPFLWEHQPVTEDCTTCHAAHGSAQPALLKMRTPFLCQTCHEGAGHPSIANSPQGLAGGMPSAYLLAGGCVNCHSQVHGSNHPSGRALMR